MSGLEKIHIPQAVIVEGKYDKIRLEPLIDALILTTNGFGIFKDKELKTFIRKLGRERGIIILTDSDRAGFQIRSYLMGMLPSNQITNVYIPDIHGKEKRKKSHSAEGKLGVEGIDPKTLRKAFILAGVSVSTESPEKQIPEITRGDLYEMGLMGGERSRELRYKLYDKLGLPNRLNLTAALPLINNLISKDELEDFIGNINL